MSGNSFDIIACGDDALRILCGPGDVRHSLAERLAGDPSWNEIVPGKQDVTIAFNPYTYTMTKAREKLQHALHTGLTHSVTRGRDHVLAAEFGGEAGPDLAQLAERLDMRVETLLEKVEQSPLKVDMLGFTPGFAYLTGLDPTLQANRLDHPRSRVPAGSIGLISGQIGLYALDGPGGWPIIGRVVSPLFDRCLTEPFVLKAGDSVKLRPAVSPQ